MVNLASAIIIPGLTLTPGLGGQAVRDLTTLQVLLTYLTTGTAHLQLSTAFLLTTTSIISIAEATVHPVETRTTSPLHVPRHPTIQLQLHSVVLQPRITDLQPPIMDLQLHIGDLQPHIIDLVALQHHTTDL